MDHSTVDRIFPCLDELLESHKSFFYNLRERKQESREGNDGNFVINRIGDILVQQVLDVMSFNDRTKHALYCSSYFQVNCITLYGTVAEYLKNQGII